MRRPVIYAILAGLSAVLAAIIVFSALRRREAEVQRAMANTVDVVVAAHDLPLGTKFTPDAVRVARWARDSVPPGSFTDPQAVSNAYAKGSFVTGEPIVASKLFMGEKTAGVMPLLIPPGMRAMSVPVDEVSDIAGFVLPRTRVDVLATISTANGDIPAFSKIVLQDVEVLAVAQEIEGSKDTPMPVKVVTLLVTPEQAERLALASREGVLRLAMRNYSDQKFVQTAGIELRDLYHGRETVPVVHSQAAGKPRAIRASGPPPVNVEIFRDGKTAESVSFVRTGLGRTMRRAQPPAGRAAPGAASASAAPPSSAPASSPDHAASSGSEPVPGAAPSPAAATGALPAAAAAPSSIGAPGASAASAAAEPAPSSPSYQPAPKTLYIP
jgi:pilus assembly protein CpaB